MWVARVLGGPDESVRRRTCQSCKAVNSKKLQPVLLRSEKLAKSLLLIADLLCVRRGRDSSLLMQAVSIVLTDPYPAVRPACG
jgi:hypothetical protein